MDDEPASEAIDGDVDHVDDPDSMEVLMGEMEMPFESAYSNCDKGYDGKENSYLFTSSTSFAQSFNEHIHAPNLVLEKPVLSIDKENKHVLPRSFKECLGFATINLFESGNSQTSKHGFVASKELKATLDGNDPIPGLGKVHCSLSISNFMVDHSLENVEDLLDEGFHHFIQSLNQLENLALHRPHITNTFVSNNRTETDSIVNNSKLHFLQ